MEFLEIQEKIKRDNLKAQQQAQKSKAITAVLLVIMLPIIFILMMFVAIGTKKEK